MKAKNKRMNDVMHNRNMANDIGNVTRAQNEQLERIHKKVSVFYVAIPVRKCFFKIDRLLILMIARLCVHMSL
jgi:hypothetical protein